MLILQVSHSRVECFENCPYRYKLRYIDKISTIKDDKADNPLFIGTMLHTALERGIDTAINEYYSQYPIITDNHVNEAIKLETILHRARVPTGRHEVKISTNDFIGYIDLIDDEYNLYDFKYSNNIEHYKNSVQIHLYKYFYQQQTRNIIHNLFYMCFPKINIKQKRDETLEEYRQRIHEQEVVPTIVKVDYNQEKVDKWKSTVADMLNTKTFSKKESWLCNYCEYHDYCQKGEDYMILPEDKKREVAKVKKQRLWIYGQPFSGKTTFASKFPHVLMLNTDGNVNFVDSPFISIKDDVEVTGRIIKRTKAWEVFKDTITELEKKDNTFETIVVDLLEDTYEYCRLYMYEQMGITHESDDSFRAWDKVRTEFLSTIKRLMNLDYKNIILISHEDTSKDITKKSGDKITAIKPNLADRVANKVAGMVDIVARVVADDNKRVLSFKTNETVFGGGRLSTITDEIPLKYDEFLKIYNGGNE